MPDQNCEVCGKELTKWNHAWGTNKCSSCAKGRSPEARRIREASPWPAKNMLWWVLFIAFYIVHELYPVFQYGIRQSSDLYIAVLFILGGVMSLVVCVWWYSVSEKRKRRNQLCRVLGYLLFAFGSMGPLSAIIAVLLPIVAGKQTPSGSAIFALVAVFLLSLVFAAGLIAAAFYLVFRPKESAPVTPQPVSYFYSIDGAKKGPSTASDLRGLWSKNIIRDDTLVLQEGETQWRSYSELFGLKKKSVETHDA